MGEAVKSFFLSGGEGEQEPATIIRLRKNIKNVADELTRCHYPSMLNIASKQLDTWAHNAQTKTNECENCTKYCGVGLRSWGRGVNGLHGGVGEGDDFLLLFDEKVFLQVGN